MKVLKREERIKNLDDLRSSSGISVIQRAHKFDNQYHNYGIGNRVEKGDDECLQIQKKNFIECQFEIFELQISELRMMDYVERGKLVLNKKRKELSASQADYRTFKRNDVKISIDKTKKEIAILNQAEKRCKEIREMVQFCLTNENELKYTKNEITIKRLSVTRKKDKDRLFSEISQLENLYSQVSYEILLNDEIIKTEKLKNDYDQIIIKRTKLQDSIHKNWVQEECEGEILDDEEEKNIECCICLESLRIGMLKLNCGHYLHKGCLLNWIKNTPKKGEQFLTNTSRCPLCRTFIGHKQDEVINRIVEPVIKNWKVMCQNISEINENHKILESHDDLSSCCPSFINDYIFYLCYDCGDLYFGGMKDCQQQQQQEEEENEREERLCEDCFHKKSRNKNYESECKIHGKDFITYKCRFCCNASYFFCFGTTHFCLRCHRILDYKVYECPGKPECNGCHVKNGKDAESEQCFGCSLCRSEK